MASSSASTGGTGRATSGAQTTLSSSYKTYSITITEPSCGWDAVTRIVNIRCTYPTVINTVVNQTARVGCGFSTDGGSSYGNEVSVTVSAPTTSGQTRETTITATFTDSTVCSAVLDALRKNQRIVYGVHCTNGTRLEIKTDRVTLAVTYQYEQAVRSVYVYTSSGWHAATPYVYSGGAWKPAVAYRWTGSSWSSLAFSSDPPIEPPGIE